MSTAKNGPTRSFEVPDPAAALEKAKDLARRVLGTTKKQVGARKGTNRSTRPGRDK